MPFIRPISSTRISSSFADHKNRRPPSGLPGTDYPVPVGTSVHAAKSGVVTRANYGTTSGKNVRIAHPDGTTSYYLHLSRIDVTNGQHVSQGQVIGKSGNTGRSTGPHLHFAIANAQGVLVDPEKQYGSGTPAPVPSRRTIKFGSRGAEVRYLQRRLRITADGLFGPLTRRAVIKFQKSHGLVADGIVGPKTWAALG
jgi:murein DD-endopeptidase MepM/ murein hydrolase activator NlpD